MSAPRPGYIAYLLRLWQVRNGTGVGWHALLQDVQLGERHGFSSLEELFEFLERETACAAHGATRAPDSPDANTT